MTRGARLEATRPTPSASVRLGEVDPALLAELPGLYGSLFATEAWFHAFDQAVPQGVCVLDHPRHVLALTRQGDTVEVLNKAFPIAAADAERACRAIFAALPDALRIHLEVLFAPRELRLPLRVLSSADDLVISLPATVDEYGASLGKKTRKNLRNFENRLRREHPDVETTVLSPTRDELVRFVDDFVVWNAARMRERGTISSFEREADRRDKLERLLLEGCAEVQVTTIGGLAAAVEFVFFVGNEATIFAGAFDPRFGDLHLGFLSTYWAVREVIGRGCSRCHLLWATSDYKQHLGARPQTATRLSVFRTPWARLWSLDEVGGIYRRAALRRGSRLYWDVRHGARRTLERAGVWPRPDGDDTR